MIPPMLCNIFSKTLMKIFLPDIKEGAIAGELTA